MSTKKSSAMSLTLIVALLCALSLVVSGCSKKAVQQSDTTGAATASKAESAPKAADADKTAKAASTSDADAAAKALAEAEAAVSRLADINFDFDKSSLSPQARTALKGHAQVLSGAKAVAVNVEGHCDERGTSEYNLALGERRAKETKAYLVELGVDANQLKTISYGKEKPLDAAHNEAAWAKNRRASFTLKK